MKLGHIAITVKDLEESKKFYSKFFGFKFRNEFTKEGTKFAYMENKNAVIELWEFEKFKENQDNLTDLSIIGLRHIAFEVDDVEKTVKELNSAGLEFEPVKLGSSGKKYSLGKDVDGIAIEIIEK